MSSASAAEEAFNALGDATRRQVFRLVQGGERSVGDIAASLPISRPAVSQHLRVLKEARLVTDRADGVRRLYSVRPTGVEALRTELETMWDAALAAFAAAARDDVRPMAPDSIKPVTMPGHQGRTKGRNHG
jgi:DNA-binding transcriptional ArsR family regulator